MITDHEVMRVLEQANPASVDDPIQMPDIAGYRAVLDAKNTTMTLIDHEPAPSEPSGGRRWLILTAAAAAVVVAIVVVATRNDDATPADQPSPTVTLPPTSPPEALTEPRLPPLGPPIECEPEPCPWSPELTAHVMSPAIRCDISTANGCAWWPFAVSPHGTLVAFDRVAATLTWYEDEPRVVPLTADVRDGGGVVAIGPHDVAYIHVPGNVIVAVAPSGAEITRTPVGSNGSVYPTASGLVPFRNGCLSVPAAPPIPWVDLDGNPITDTRSFPTATATDAGIEIRLGEREWVLADDEAGSPERACFAFQPRSDGGVVFVGGTSRNRDRVTVFELLPDGTIERYFIDDQVPSVLPDGSMIVEHDHELVRLAPPAA